MGLRVVAGVLENVGSGDGVAVGGIFLIWSKGQTKRMANDVFLWVGNGRAKWWLTSRPRGRGRYTESLFFSMIPEQTQRAHLGRGYLEGRGMTHLSRLDGVLFTQIDGVVSIYREADAL
jgi:hypothetical protein